MHFEPAGLTPLIFVFDMTKALTFYRDLLGFTVVSASPEVETREGQFSHWMWLRFGRAEIMLNTQYDSNERPEQPVIGKVSFQKPCFYIGCTSIEAAYEHLLARGVKIGLPVLASYGLKFVSVTDPDGHAIIFQEVR